MMKKRIKEEADRLIPKDFRSILGSINSDFDWAILSELSKNEKTRTELIEDLGVENNEKFESHLEKLLENGLIKVYYKNEFVTADYLFYALTNLGKNVINSIDVIFNFSGEQPRTEKKP
ncbi:MAG: helix-turn-helix domain-containing protein [Candidatus Micrarchaeia archaeon]